MLGKNIKPSKFFVLKEVEEMIIKNPNLSILDLGSGKSLNFENIIKKYPSISYTGLEPFWTDFSFAKDKFAMCKNTQFINDLAYKDNSSLMPEYDLVISLSVLEHVKQLEKFLKFSSQKTISKGRCIHLYDLSHSLHPSSLKEKFQVWLCNHRFFKKFIPEHKFASYIDSNSVIQILKSSNLNLEKITQHNIPDHIKLLKSLEEVSEETISNLAEKEVGWADLIHSKKKREELFPAVCVWFTKN